MSDCDRVKDLALSGHNIIITGQCGTGKTHLLKALMNELSNSRKKVAVTATTGMASSQLGRNASTLHHWSGILDGRFQSDHLLQLFDNDDHFAAANLRIKGTDSLIIDEISMLSKRTIEQVEEVCRHVRKCEKIFGGIQVIACGDFKQLPPVPNHRMQDDGLYCLESEMFKKAFTHHVNLKKVVRQNEPDLVKAIHELCDGTPSADTIQLMRSLNRPLPENVEVTRLYGTNFDVNYVNHEMLDAVEGNAAVFRAKDEGPANLFTHVNAPKNLLLKVGAPVILIRNIAGGLYNGARGKVHSLEHNSPPVINFRGKLVTLKTYNFDVYDMHQQKVIASRIQYPIMLAFAMTVHRAQGQTIEFVDVDCFSFFAAGHLGVAVGRVISKAGLRVQNFNLKAAFMKHSACVYDFYCQEFRDPSDDFSCCRPIIISSREDEVHSSKVNVSSSSFVCNSDTEFEMDMEFPQLQTPWNINEFLIENEYNPFFRVSHLNFTIHHSFCNM